MKKTLEKLRATLIPIYGKSESDAIIRLIFHYVKGWSVTDMVIHSDDELSPFVVSEIDKILSRLKEGEPIQYIVEEARFHGLDLKVEPGVLIPRLETEELVDLIIDAYGNKKDLKILDLCTGSGCIAVALANALPFSEVKALDYSDIAIKVAQENAERQHVKIDFIKEDIFTFQPKDKFDVIVSNPPYVMEREALKMERNVLDYEPLDAIFVKNENPLEFYDKIGDIARESLTEGGSLFLEINPLTSERLYDLMKRKGFREVEIFRDSSGKKRFMRCQI